MEWNREEQISVRVFSWRSWGNVCVSWRQFSRRTSVNTQCTLGVCSVRLDLSGTRPIRTDWRVRTGSRPVHYPAQRHIDSRAMHRQTLLKSTEMCVSIWKCTNAYKRGQISLNLSICWRDIYPPTAGGRHRAQIQQKEWRILTSPVGSSSEPEL